MQADVVQVYQICGEQHLTHDFSLVLGHNDLLVIDGWAQKVLTSRTNQRVLFFIVCMQCANSVRLLSFYELCHLRYLILFELFSHILDISVNLFDKFSPDVLEAFFLYFLFCDSFLPA